MTMSLVMVTFVPIMLFLVMTLVRGSSSLPPPITVTLLPLDPRQYNTRDRQLVLYRLPICKPLSGALYVTFNSVQIDFVYFIGNAFTLLVVCPKACNVDVVKKKEGKGCIDKAAAAR